jgi:two-component system, NtrC family, response regulator
MGRVVVIDDDPQYADLLKRQLSGAGHETICCGSLQTGHQAVFSFAPDLVLLDIRLPDGNGLEEIDSIKAAPCLPEVIVITASGDEDGAELAIRSGVWGYWQKGRSVHDLMLNIGQALAYRAERQARCDWRSLELGGLVGESQAMVACFGAIAEASSGDIPVLISGETGTGKEMVAEAVHKNSDRAGHAFVTVDCASLTETLVESSLFGHEKGAFTGATTGRVGLVRQAHEGVLFLDEIGELPLSLQKVLLRVLQEKRFRPVGSDHETLSDFRLLAATNRNLKQMVEAGTFREDLYFRLKSMEIVLPPLHLRGSDVVRIAESVSAKACSRLALPPKGLSLSFCEALLGYSWPGNVRELKHAVESAVVTAGRAQALEVIHLPIQVRIQLARASVLPELNCPAAGPNRKGRPTLSEVRDEASVTYLSQLLNEVHGDIEAACRIADVSRSRLYGLLKAHGIVRAGHNKASQTEALAPVSCSVS